MKKTLMAVGAHCDDIEFVMGGTLLKYHQRFNYEVVYVQASNNMSGEWSQALLGERAKTAPQVPAWMQPVKSIETGKIRKHIVPWYHEMPQRKREAEAAALKYFNTTPIHLDYPQRHYKDSNLNMVDLRYGAARPECVPENFPTILTAPEDEGAVRRVSELILEKDPEVIITNAPVDCNVEHTSTCHLLRKAFIEAKKCGYVGSLIFAQTVTSGDCGKFFDCWDAFVDISGFSDLKREAIGVHACQVPYPERLDLEDKQRGKICGVEEAETFFVYEISETRTGELTEELKQNNRYCLENFQEMFFTR
jgi:LmbE family N-acetylglucosaminyl deacetylase